MRYAAAVEYIGTAYSGWQRQPHAVGVQNKVEAALGRIANQAIEVSCAGRTDAGVHAIGQVIHFDSEVQREPRQWLLGANALLPPDISLRWVQPVSEDFHARFSAFKRRYFYFIHDDPARSAVLSGRVTWSRQHLNTDLMHEAGQYLLGEQDFSSFRAAECQSNTAMRCVHQLSVRREAGLVLIDIEANAFLHHMVRNIAGTLMAVGSGKRPVSWVEEVLEARDRTRSGVTAPAEGLYFVEVQYPENFELPTIATTAILPLMQ